MRRCNAPDGDHRQAAYATLLPLVLLLYRGKGVCKNVIANFLPLFDSFIPVPRPVNTEIDPALTVFFLCLRQRVEAARDNRPDIAAVITGDTVKLIGRERECDIIATVKLAQSFE